MVSKLTDNNRSSNYNGATKIMGVVVILVTTVLAVYNMGAPDRLRITYNADRISKVEDHVRQGELDHAAGLEKTATISERFKEIETQFKNMDERTKRIEDRSSRELAALDDRLQMEFKRELNSVVSKEDVLPRIAVLEHYIRLIKKELNLTLLMPND